MPLAIKTKSLDLSNLSVKEGGPGSFSIYHLAFLIGSFHFYELLLVPETKQWQNDK
jgi:hypothetical protein